MAAKQRRAVVTGGGRGIGRACAASLSAAGHRVAILGRKEAPLKEAVAAGVAAEYHLVDVTEEASLTGCLRELGAIDILVNNAGIADSAPIGKTDIAFFRRLMAVNFESAVIGIRAVLPGMVSRSFGRIISISSIAGLKGIPYTSAYVASKHAVIGLTRALALEVARSGVTVNAVCPGYVDTDLVSEGAARVAGATGRPVDEIKRSFYRGNPQQRLITSEEVADAVLWLSGDLAASVNGQAIVVSGGEI